MRLASINNPEAIEDPLERIELQSTLANWAKSLGVDRAEARARAEELVESGLGVADAAHVAYAEQSDASFISVDDRLLRKCERISTAIWYGNPVGFCEEEELR